MKLSQTGTNPKNILRVFRLGPPPAPHLPFHLLLLNLFKATVLCGDPLGRIWHLKECGAGARVCELVCVGMFVCSTDSGVEEQSCLHTLIVASNVQRSGRVARFTPNTTCQAK